MAKFVVPQSFLIAETAVSESGLAQMFQALGVKDWKTDASNDAELLTEVAGKSCYMSFDKDLNKNLTKVGARNNHDYIQKGIVANKHGSVLEHSTVTFFIANVSRVVTHELVRHRAGVAVSQTSGRYVRTDELSFYLPMDIACNEKAKDVFIDAMVEMEEAQRELEKVTRVDEKPFDLKKKLTSAFRRIIGNGQANNIVVTANHRAWRHMIEMRTSRHAEEEIRVVFEGIAIQLKAKYPAIYADMKSETIDGIREFTFEHSKV